MGFKNVYAAEAAELRDRRIPHSYVVYCHTCRIDLRIKNVKFHAEHFRHDVRAYEFFPGDSRIKSKLEFPLEALIPHIPG